MRKVLAIVGAGEAAMPIVKKASELSIKTIGFGEKDSIAKDLFDVFVEKSIFDIDGMYDDCIAYGVTGVIASSEITTESAAVLADRLNLPGNRINDGFCARNKYLMRQKVEKLVSVKQPSFYLYDGREISEFPIMVKAVDSCGKRGIQLVKNTKELEQAIKTARELSSDNSALIEEYIEGGQEFSVESLSNGEVVTIVQMTEKETSGPPHFAEIAHHQPANLSAILREKVITCVKDVLQVLGITCGMAHMEIKICGEDIYFIEVGARAGGDHIADTLTLLSTDFDYYKGAIDCCFGEYVPQKINNVAFSGIYFYCKQNQAHMDLFECSKTADWCVLNTISTRDLNEISNNCDAADAGYFIYCADHRIGG